MIKKHLKWVSLAMATMVLSACTTTGSGTSGNAGGQNGDDVSGYYGVEASTYHDANYGQRGTADRVIYFDFDSDRLRSESYNVVKAHSDALKSTPNRGVWLDGHTDDRGSHEYNMGLGERRGNSVRDVMISNGVNPAQIRVRSYGKELPAVAGYDEGAWAQNRRVEIVY